MTFEVVDGVAAEWPALAAGGPLFATPAWLRAMSGRLGPSVVTLLVRRHGVATLAAYASVQHAHRPGELFDPYDMLVAPSPELPLTPWSRSARAALVAEAPPPEAWAPYLLVMLPGYECTPVGSGDLVDLVDGAVALAAARGLPTVAMLYVRPESTAFAAALTGRGFTAVPLTPTWDLPVPAGGLDGYLAALPHKRRKEARRELRLLDSAGVVVEPVAVASVFDELVRLRCALVTKYRSGRDLAAERTKLRRVVDDVAGGSPHVLLASAGSVPLGFALFAPHGDQWHCLAVGADHADPRSRLTYFATAYYHAAALASRHGVRTIGYGLGAWPAKRARGCRPTPLTGYIHTTDPDLAAALTHSAKITELTIH